jgi:phage tail-like protein
MPPARPQYQPKGRWRVRFGGEHKCHFRSCSSLEGEFELIKEREAGNPDVADIQTGNRSFPDFTLVQGGSNDDYLWQLWKKTGDPETGAQRPQDEIQVDVYLDEMAADLVTVKRTWKKPKCVMQKFVAGEFDASASENVIRSVTFGCAKLLKEGGP